MRYLTIAGIAFLLLLVGFPGANVANGLGFFAIIFAALATMVSATEAAKKAFIAAIALFAFGQTYVVLRAIAWHVAPVVIGTVLLGTLLYALGVKAWKRLTSDAPTRQDKPERPKIRARADLAATYLLPETPEADQTPFDLFGSSRRGRR